MLAKMLDANPRIICVSDPYAPLYKSFRNRVAEESGFVDIDPLEPLNDYYFEPAQNNLFQSIQETGLDLSLPTEELESLRERIHKHCQPYSPGISKFLRDLDGSNYTDLFKNGNRLLAQAYPKDGAQAVGSKEVWIGEFAPHFFRLAQGNKVVFVVRDPRAVVASNYASPGIYPLLFLIRQWRKLASLAWWFSQGHSQAMLLKYEEVVADPAGAAQSLCEFLDVDYSADMLDPGGYRDGDGKPWKQNSSYQDIGGGYKGQQFEKRSLEKWKEVLPPMYTQVVDTLCYFEMKLLGYTPSIPVVTSVLLDFEDNVETFSEWIRPYSNYNYFKEISVELYRHRLLSDQKEVSTNVQQLLSLLPGIHEGLCSNAAR